MEAWAKKNPKILGVICILFGAGIAGAILFGKGGTKTWREYSINSVEKIEITRKGRTSYAYHMRTGLDFRIGIDSKYSDLLDEAKLSGQSPPFPVEIWSTHESKHTASGLIKWADGLKLLRGGDVILDPVAVEKASSGDDNVGLALAAVLVLAGLGLQVYKPKTA